MKKLILLIFIICNLIGCSLQGVKTSFNDAETYSKINQDFLDLNNN